MEFEEMQRIWNKQDEAPLYAINEATLLKRIRSKSRSTEFGLNLLEGGIIGSSIVSLGALYINWAGDDVPTAFYLVPIMLIVISGYVLALRRRRKVNATRYQATIISELEKAIAHNEFLLERIQTIFWWYLLPVFGGFFGLLLFPARTLLASISHCDAKFRDPVSSHYSLGNP